MIRVLIPRLSIIWCFSKRPTEFLLLGITVTAVDSRNFIWKLMYPFFKMNNIILQSVLVVELRVFQSEKHRIKFKSECLFEQWRPIYPKDG
jgi:hypothetical protein